MNAVAINSTKVCCKTNNTLFSKSEVKKQLLLFLTFLFLGMFLSFGQTFSGTSGAIDDDNCPITNDFTTNVSGVGVLGTTNHFNEVVINITHTYDSDLEITLISPSGAASVLLSSSNGGGGNDFTDTHFRLDAITPISSGTAPFTGDFLPDGDLTDFDGTNADGIWTLQICDNAGQDIGTLDSWEIIFGTEPVEPFDCTNPINPSPSCNDFKVILVLDESGSIGNATGTEAKVEAATLALANVLVGTGAQLSIVEFSTNSQIGSYGGYTNWNTVDQAYYNALSANLGASYVPNGWTNWEAALDDVITLNNIAVADIVLFMTDGNPTACVTCGLSPSTNSSQAATFLNAAIDESCEIKQQGSHIMMMGVGANISIANLQAISGPILDDGPGNPTLTPLTSDYNLIDPINLTACFLDIAQNSCNNDLSLEKTVYAGHDNGAGCDGSKTIPKPSNSQVTYCFTITNDGDQTISNMDFEDSDIGIDENDLTPAFVTSMIAGQSITYYYEETLSGGQVFPFLNTADVTGQTLTGDPLSDSSSAEVTEPLCTQAATCNLTNIVEEGCEIPAALTESTVVFSGIEACSAVITMDYTDVGDTDVCGDGDGADFVRTYTLYFDSVAFATCVQNIIINDSTPPVIDNPNSISDISCNDLLPTQQSLSATDCNSVITVVPSIDAYTVDVCNGYAITYRWTATDDCNNTSEKTVTFNVLPDTAPPVLDEPSAISDISCSDTLPTQETLTATDDCGVATVIPSVDAYTVDVCNGYAITYRWTATDGCTNSSEKTVTFNVLPDTTPPNAINACPLASDFGFSNVQCKIDLPTGDEAEDAFWNQSIPMFFEDNCSTLEGVNISDPMLIGDDCSGTAIYTIDYYDACGNLNNQCTFSINYGDTMPPVLAEPSAISDISCSATLPIQETLTATDNCGSATVVPSIDAYTVDICNGYAITYRWTATDDCTNTSEKTVTFNVLPSPVLEVNCPLAVNLNSSSTQQEIQDAYDAWKLGFTYTGGCDATDNLGNFPSLPDFNCGTGIDLSFTYTATDLCNPNGVSCSSTFVVPGVIGLTVTCPDPVNLPACSSEADIIEAFNTWKAGFIVNGGDNPTSNIDLIEDFDPTQLFNCYGSGSLGFDFSAYDACNPNGVTCFSEFGIDSNEQLELSAKPADVTTSACVNPADEFAAWILALESMTASGGCNAEVEYSVDLTTLSVDGYCNIAGQVVSVDINAKDDCGETAPVTATFTVPAYSNDLALIGDCPTDNEVDGCSTNAEISAAFDIWKAAVLANFSATGGCNAEVEYSTDVSALQAPTQCGTSDQTVSVDINASDDCAKTIAITCSFTVKAFESNLDLTEVVDESYASCDYETQTELEAAFQTFLAKFGYTGGCDASGQLASAYSAPDLCAGGTVNVTYDVTDLCENGSETASFTITPSAVLEVSCPTGVSLDSSSTEQEIQDAYDAWKLEFTKTGGCDATDNLGNFPSLPDYVCDTSIDLSFDYVATDRCNPDGVSCSSTFNVEGRESVDAGENGALTICENGTVTAQDLFEALGGDPDEGGSWSPEPGGANTYIYTVEGLDPCPDATAEVTVEELVLEISASEPVCDEDYGTYAVNVQVSEGTVTSTLGTPIDNGGGSWTITDILVDNDIVITVTSTVSNGVECDKSVDVISPDCICIELDLDYTDVSCFGLNDGTITVDYVTDGAIVTVNGEPYDANLLYEPGIYTVVAYFDGNDDEDCIISEEITIVEPVLVDIQVSSTDVTCNGGSDGTITILSLSEGAYYTIKRNGVGPDLSGQDYFTPGTYVVEAKLIDNTLTRMAADGKNVTTRSQNPCVDGKLVVIGQPDMMSCRMSKSFPGEEIRCGDRTNNMLTINHMGGVGPYTYSWSMDKSGYYGMWEIQSGAEAQTMTYIPGFNDATFMVEVTDANGCTTLCEVTLKSTCTKADYYNGLFRQAEFDFEMYPNPTQGKLTIKPNRLSGNNVTVEVYDLVGTKILNQSFSKIGDKEVNINLSGLASQVYYVKVITKDGTKIKKVVLDK